MNEAEATVEPTKKAAREKAKRARVAMAQLQGKAVERFVVYNPDCCGTVVFKEQPKPARKVTCPCGCGHVIPMDYSCCSSDGHPGFDGSDVDLEPGMLYRMTSALSVVK